MVKADGPVWRWHCDQCGRRSLTFRRAGDAGFAGVSHEALCGKSVIERWEMSPARFPATPLPRRGGSHHGSHHCHG